MNYDEATQRVDAMINRWEETLEWHDPEFLEGEIHITTGDLLALKVVIDHIAKEVSAVRVAQDSYAEGMKGIDKQIRELREIIPITRK